MTKKGLTLLEVLVTLLVLSILVALTVPSLRSLTEENRLRNAAEDLYHNMQYVRAKAVAEQLNVVTHFTTGSSWCYGFNKNSACDCANLAACDLGGKQSTDYGQISLATTGLTATGNLTIDGVRGIFGSSGTMTFTLGGNSISVKVSALGNITICSPSVSGYDPC